MFKQISVTLATSLTPFASIYLELNADISIFVLQVLSSVCGTVKLVVRGVELSGHAIIRGGHA